MNHTTNRLDWFTIYINLDSTIFRQPEIMSFLKSFIFNSLNFKLYYRYAKRRFAHFVGLKGRTAWISAPACRTHFAGNQHPESPNRLIAIENILRHTHTWARMQKIQAKPINDIQLARVHTRNYINELENQTPAQGVHKIDDDTYLSRDTFDAARYGAGAAVQAVDMVMKQYAKNAFCAIRPPGHHAHANHAGGFCFINNAAVAAMHAISEYRLERVAILDFDLHHGDGTEDIFQNDKRVMLLSSFESPLYPFTGTDYQGKNPNIINTPLKAGDSSDVFREMVRSIWLPKLASFRPQLIVLSAGFDAHRDDDLGHLNLTEDDFGWLTQKIVLVAERHAQGRIVSVLEGGYCLDSLAVSVKAHLNALVSANRFAQN